MSVSEGEKGGCLPKWRLLLSPLRNKDKEKDCGGSQRALYERVILKGKLCQLAVEDVLLFCEFKSSKKILFWLLQNSGNSSSSVYWLTTLSVNGNILRTPCAQYGNFSIIKQGFILAGSILQTYKNLTVEECEFECILHQNCRSINTKFGFGVNCELVSQSINFPLDKVTLSSQPGWSYRTTNYSEKNVGKLCRKLKPCPAEQSCVDSCHCPGYQCILVHAQKIHANCQEAYMRGLRISKDYVIQPNPDNIFSVPCDMTTNGGGWVVFQRRIDASVDFHRNWAEYKNGFGDLNGNFWLGLKKLHLLAGPGKRAILRIDLKHINWPYMIYAEYSTFEIANEADMYRLKVEGYSGNATDSLADHTKSHHVMNGQRFSTKDKDNDHFWGNCADHFKGGWWFNSCHGSNLNGLYPPNDQTRGTFMSWYYFKNAHGRVIFSEMKLKYV